jgi:hypothetical protein
LGSLLCLAFTQILLQRVSNNYLHCKILCWMLCIFCSRRDMLDSVDDDELRQSAAGDYAKWELLGFSTIFLVTKFLHFFRLDCQLKSIEKSKKTHRWAESSERYLQVLPHACYVTRQELLQNLRDHAVDYLFLQQMKKKYAREDAFQLAIKWLLHPFPF